VCEERAVTGTKELIDRPALSALMVALQSDGIKVVSIEALNRLARDLMIQESIVADFKRQRDHSPWLSLTYAATTPAAN
jgi:DNA invertase Pin-like site-specific DNA recombinase